MKLPEELKREAAKLIYRQARLNRVLKARKTGEPLSEAPLTKEEMDEAASQLKD